MASRKCVSLASSPRSGSPKIGRCPNHRDFSLDGLMKTPCASRRAVADPERHTAETALERFEEHSVLERSELSYVRPKRSAAEGVTVSERKTNDTTRWSVRVRAAAPVIGCSEEE